MTDRDSQLDTIEGVAEKGGSWVIDDVYYATGEIESGASIAPSYEWIKLPRYMFQPGGLYYEMRREVEYHRECRKLDVPEGE